MTPDPTLTDDELARLDAHSWSGSFVTPSVKVRRLIAALRASRAENASLSSQLSTYQAKERDCWRAVGW